MSGRDRSTGSPETASRPDPGGGLSRRSLETGLMGLLCLWGLAMIVDAFRMGVGWSLDGPAAGTFTLATGLGLIGACLALLTQLWKPAAGGPLPALSETVLDRTGLRIAARVLLPMIALILVTPLLGLYLALALMLVVMMRLLQPVSWPIALGTASGTAVLLFVLFERAFLLPLPKGPVELWLGL